MMGLARKLKIDRESGIAFAEQIFTFFSDAIRSGGIAVGTRLPSIRDLAEDLGINKIAVVTAYERLVSDGLVNSRPGSGFFASWRAVRTGLSLDPAPIQLPESHESGEQIAATMAVERALSGTNPREWTEEGPDPETVTHLGGAYAPFDLLPMEELRSVARAALSEENLAALAYEHLGGVPHFRKRLADECEMRGIPVSHPQQIVVTSGLVATLSVIAEALTTPGDSVLVEVPCYGMLFPLLRDKRLQVLELERSFDLLHFTEEKVTEIKRAKPKLILVTPNFQNPTGGVLQPHHRFELLRLAQEIDAIIVEMDVYHGLGFGDVIPPSLASLDGLRRVIYVSSFSRSLAAGIRVSFLAASKQISNQIFSRAVLLDVACSNSDQMMVAEFLARGLWRKHLQRLRGALRSRRDTLIAMLRKLAPSGSQWTVPEGGNFLWFEFPPGAEPQEIQRLTLDKGVNLAPGSLFYPNPRPSRHMRLGFGVLEPVRTYNALESTFRIWRAFSQQKKAQAGSQT